ncbi:MAG: Bax inhibitor-1/YccA family protein [Paludisphaera borealis]|uniref:Bax inhibitor-1/YccA family protein n=1 Tax=Paludisphaera borealis TaxID=1387353 RepID=UPI0028405312|nr:Bax inhibitor-1/YccA family protein [Paludisphaera borealis]MDR3620535.1 Bax inhibitor-1/YccA family protein [Paludisphaera borealis]
MATSNPAFSQDMFAGYNQVYGAPRSMVTTVQGTMSKTFLLLAILSGTGLWAFHTMAAGQLAYPVVGVSALAGFVLAMVTIFKPTISPWTAPVYAAMQGVFLGSLSQIVEMRMGVKGPHGIALQAVSLTVGTLLVMLFLYASGTIKVTERLKAGIMMATGAVCLFYVVSMVLGFFGVAVPLIFSATPAGIGFSLFVCGLAAFNLLLDFDFIEEAARREAPKYMEWYGAFGLIVTLVWLYLELLRLLQKINSRN